MSEEKIYTLNELSEYLKVHRNTIYRWVKEGRLESLKIGKAFRFTESAVSNFMHSQTSNAKELV